MWSIGKLGDGSADSASLVVLADDEPAILDTLQFVLEAEGFSVLTFGNGVDAMRAIEDEQPKVAVLDLLMPGLPGHEICRLVRLREELARTSLVIMSALPVDEARKRLREARPDFFLEKPFEHGELVTVVGRAIAGVSLEGKGSSRLMPGIPASLS